MPDECVKFSEDFYFYLSKNGGKQNITDKDINSGAKTIDKLIRIDKWDLEEEVRPALRWGVSNQFWSKQVRSLAPLRKKSQNGETKFANLFSAFSARDVKGNFEPKTIRDAHSLQCGAIAKILLEERDADNSDGKESCLLLEP